VVLIGGFAGGGNPRALIAALIRRGARDLTLIGNSFTLLDDNRFLVEAGLVRKIITSFPVPAAGPPTAVDAQWRAGTLEVETVPQGTLIERLRAGGAGIGGFYTPTGVGTRAAEGKEVRVLNGRPHVLELPLRGDVALVHAHTADGAGNLAYRLAARNYNPILAMAADTVIAEVERLVPTGELDPDRIGTPGVLVSTICLLGGE
jgi:3-oxoadipate CoA-transferase alpha subunit